jgi:hypothetical protein
MTQKTNHMKKLFTLATAALLMTGFAFAHEGDKDKKKGKTCCKDSKECSKSEKKETKETAKTAKAATKAAKKA